MVEVYQFGPFNSEDGTMSLMDPSLSPTERLVKKSAYDAAIDALRLLFKEMELSGNLGSKDYGWPKAITATRAILDAQSETGAKCKECVYDVRKPDICERCGTPRTSDRGEKR